METTLTTFDIIGTDEAALAALRASGADHGGNAVEPFYDGEGGWPLRCCLTDSQAGDELAIVAWSPFPWAGPYAEVGPIAIHARSCAGVRSGDVPEQFLSRRQLVRPYATGRIAYDDVVIVDGDGSLPLVLEHVLSKPEIEFAHVRNVLSGCWSFTARRRP